MDMTTSPISRFVLNLRQPIRASNISTTNTCEMTGVRVSYCYSLLQAGILFPVVLDQIHQHRFFRILIARITPLIALFQQGLLVLWKCLPPGARSLPGVEGIIHPAEICISEICVFKPLTVRQKPDRVIGLGARRSIELAGVYSWT